MDSRGFGSLLAVIAAASIGLVPIPASASGLTGAGDIVALGGGGAAFGGGGAPMGGGFAPLGGAIPVSPAVPVNTTTTGTTTTAPSSGVAGPAGAAHPVHATTPGVVGVQATPTRSDLTGLNTESTGMNNGSSSTTNNNNNNNQTLLFIPEGGFFAGGGGGGLATSGSGEINSGFATPQAPSPVVQGPMNVRLSNPAAVPRAFATREVMINGMPQTVTEPLVTDFHWPSTGMSSGQRHSFARTRVHCTRTKKGRVCKKETIRKSSR